MIFEISTQVNSDPEYWHFSDIDKETGYIDIKSFCDRLSFNAFNFGANSFRNFWLVRDTKLHKKDLGNNRLFLPYQFDFDLNLYDFYLFNEIYFYNQREMMKSCWRHKYYYKNVMWDECHNNMPESPFMKNKQGKKGFHQWDKWSERYVVKVLDNIDLAIKEIKSENIEPLISFELCNEPRKDYFLKLGLETLKLIKARGYDNDQIELGVFFIGNKIDFKKIWDKKKNEYKYELIKTDLFEDFKKVLKDHGLYDGSQKDEFAFTIHDYGNNAKKLKELIEMVPHSHKIKISNDGEKPKKDGNTWEKNVTPIFQRMTKGVNGKKAKRMWICECFYNGDLNGYSMFGDDINGFGGMTRAYIKTFKENPGNFGKFKNPIYPPIIEEKPKPEPVEPPKDYKELYEKYLYKIKVITDDHQKLSIEYGRLERKYIWKFFGGFKKKFPFVSLKFWTLIKKDLRGVIFGLSLLFLYIILGG